MSVWITITVLFVTNACASDIESYERKIPLEVKELYEKFACVSQGEEWWSDKRHPGKISPPYVFYPQNQKESVVFLCEKKDKKNQLIYHTEGDSGFNCPRLVHEVSSDKGLRIVDNHIGQTLKGFYRFGEDKKTSIPLGPVLKKYPSIYYEYDGAGAEFYCHENKWWVRSFH